MSVYNAGARLASAVESILVQTFADFEFLIVDDGSIDGSNRILDTFARQDSRIRVLRQGNHGLVASLNRLIAEARGPLIARMDGDDIALPGRLERQLAFLEAHADVGVLGASTRDIDEAGRLFDDPPSYPTNHETLVRELRQASPFCHPSVIMRTELVRAAGGYRPAFRHCEDYDLWLRLSGRTRFANLPERLLHYRRSPAQVSNRHALMQHYGRALAWRAHERRLEGRPDPMEGRDALPPIEQLDALFGLGTARAVRAEVALGIVYSQTALRGEGLELILDHVRAGGATRGLWRTVVRLATLREPRRAVALAAALARRAADGLALPRSASRDGLPKAHLYPPNEPIKEIGT